MSGIVVLLIALAYARADDGKVVGGSQVTEIGKWPWQGSLIFTSSGSHTCGCVLISERYVLTAGHCVGSGASAYSTIFGLHDRSNHNIGNPTTHRVASVLVHPDYVESGVLRYPNDIAIITLSTNVVFDSYKRPAAMAPYDDGQGNPDYTRSLCYITGWGRTFGGSPLPNVLMEVEIPVISEAECQSHWGTLVTRTHICIYDSVNKDTGACNGDSGGPLACSNDNGNSWVVAGLASWVASGCDTRYPSAYTRVSFHRAWVRDNTGLPL